MSKFPWVYIRFSWIFLIFLYCRAQYLLLEKLKLLFFSDFYLQETSICIFISAFKYGEIRQKKTFC